MKKLKERKREKRTNNNINYLFFMLCTEALNMPFCSLVKVFTKQ